MKKQLGSNNMEDYDKIKKILAIGVKPRFLFDEERIDESRNCYQYFEANYLRPIELFEVYDEIAKRFQVKE